MIQRILTGWTLTRVVFLILGAIMIAQAIWDKQWFGIAFGSYFTLMGLFALGCASGNCAGGDCRTASPAHLARNKELAEHKQL